MPGPLAQLLDNIPTKKLFNQTVINNLISDDTSLRKEAIDTVNDYTRRKIREDGFLRRIIPPVSITNEDLTRQVDTDKPVVVVDFEPDSPGAISVPFASLPVNRYIRGPRYRVMFDRILSQRFTKDVNELRTYDMDIRQILSDNSIKDMLAEEDSKLILTLNSLLLGPNVVIPETGVAQWVTISGGVSRDTVAEAMKTLPRAITRLSVSTALVNHVTIWDFVKWGRDEAGGDISETWLRNGFAETTLMNVRWIITIKRDLVPDNTIYLFAEPKFIGKLYLLEDTTLSMERRAFMLDFFSYESLGCTIANPGSIGRVDFT